MAYEVASFVSLTLRGAKLEDVREGYAAWLLGRWPGYDGLRPKRLKIGVDQRWLPQDIRAAKKLQGSDDYELESREAPGLWLLRYRHRDGDKQAVFFQHQVRLQQQADVVIVDHGIRRSAPRELLEPLERSPRPLVIEDLLRKYHGVRPLNLSLPVTTLEADDVEGFVGNLLFDPASVPWVVVSPDDETADPLVDPAELHRWLQGIAAVAVLRSVAATWALSQSLKRRGLSDNLRCFGGAVRSYDSSRTALRLPFLMPLQLSATPPNQRTKVAGAELSRRLAVRRMPPSFFSLIEEEDHQERHRTVEHLRAQLEQGTSSVAELRQHAQRLEGLLTQAEQETLQLTSEKNELVEGVQEAEMARDEALEKMDEETRRLGAEVARLRAETNELREKLRAADLTPELLADISAALRGEHSPIRSVELVERVYGARITFLPSAKVSARKAVVFKRPDKVTQLLWTLTTDYYAALAAGRGDVEARRCFGKDEFASRDKNNLSARGKRLRTFEWNGEGHLMEMHLKDGVKESDAECLRIHFKWFPEERRIVVGHCGGHLDF